MLVLYSRNITTNIVLRNHIKKIRLLFCKDKESYLCFYKLLGFIPNDLKYYKQSLIHKSSSVITDEGYCLNNERLEFLGDAILDAVIGDLLFHHFDAKKEGFLTNTRSKIVQRETLNKLALEMGLENLLINSTNSSSHNNYMYGNALEALIGAIYLDQGYTKCKAFIEDKIIDKYIDLDRLAKIESNFKSKLIEWSQKHKIKLSFELIEEFQDENSNPIFQTEVQVEGVSGGRGVGYSKKESQQNASQKTLERIKNSKEFMNSVYLAKESSEKASSIDETEEPIKEEVSVLSE